MKIYSVAYFKHLIKMLNVLFLGLCLCRAFHLEYGVDRIMESETGTSL